MRGKKSETELASGVLKNDQKHKMLKKQNQKKTLFHQKKQGRMQIFEGIHSLNATNKLNPQIRRWPEKSQLIVPRHRS